MKSELEKIPGIGPALAQDLQKLNIHKVKDLANKDPETLYNDLCTKEKTRLDRCVLYAFRCAVYYASHTTHKPEKLKWWNWKDKA